MSNRLRVLVAILALTAGLGGMVCVARAQEKAAALALSEVQQLKAQVFKLKAENAQLRLTVAQAEATLAQVGLTTEQQTLLEEFRATLKASPGETFNWQTLTFDKKPEPPKVVPK
jgi:uncharacterized protein YlxW (UPF0749 family)